MQNLRTTLAGIMLGLCLTAEFSAQAEDNASSANKQTDEATCLETGSNGIKGLEIKPDDKVVLVWPDNNKCADHIAEAVRTKGKLVIAGFDPAMTYDTTEKARLEARSKAFLNRFDHLDRCDAEQNTRDECNFRCRKEQDELNSCKKAAAERGPVVEGSVFSPVSGPLTERESVGIVIFNGLLSDPIDDPANLEQKKLVAKFFTDAYDALKPGGIVVPEKMGDVETDAIAAGFEKAEGSNTFTKPYPSTFAEAIK